MLCAPRGSIVLLTFFFCLREACSILIKQKASVPLSLSNCFCLLEEKRWDRRRWTWGLKNEGTLCDAYWTCYASHWVESWTRAGIFEQCAFMGSFVKRWLVRIDSNWFVIWCAHAQLNFWAWEAFSNSNMFRVFKLSLIICGCDFSLFLCNRNLQ